VTAAIGQAAGQRIVDRDIWISDEIAILCQKLRGTVIEGTYSDLRCEI